MSDTPKEKKYQFESKVKLPNMQEILDAASDFTPPSEKKLEVKAETSKKLDIKELTKKVTPLSSEQEELQKLGDQVADAEVERAKAKERARAEELRRLCREREEVAKKKADEERKVADEERRKAIEAAREKARARKDAEAAAAAAEEQAAQEAEDMELLLSPVEQGVEKLPPVLSESAKSEDSGENEEDISEVAENPFEKKTSENKPKEKEEFKETVLEDDYKEEMGLREDSSEAVDDDFLDF